MKMLQRESVDGLFYRVNKVEDLMSGYFVPELLSPAGNLAKLKTAISYGATAVYAGGQKFGLRAASDNFTLEELERGAKFCHERGRKIYVVLNSFLHDKDLEELPPFIDFLNQIKIDALIISDLGVISKIKEISSIPIHLSTQATCLNVLGAKLWSKMGVERIIVGREASIEQTKKIKKETNLEVEMFIHGSMCMAYSGNCVISNFTHGRDSNRGGCAHSCRFEYSLYPEEDVDNKEKAFFMSSKDLNGFELLDQYIDAGIDSVKVEGRMKSELYAGTISKTYSQALRYYQQNGDFGDNLKTWSHELSKVAHREYQPVNLIKRAGAESIYNERDHEKSLYSNAGIVVGCSKESIIIKVKNGVKVGDTLEVIPFQSDAVKLDTSELKDYSNNSIAEAKPNSILRFPFSNNIEKHNIVRSKIRSKK